MDDRNLSKAGFDMTYLKGITVVPMACFVNTYANLKCRKISKSVTNRLSETSSANGCRRDIVQACVNNELPSSLSEIF